MEIDTTSFFGQFHDAVGDSVTCLRRFPVVFAVQDAGQLAFASLSGALRASVVFEKPQVDFAIAFDMPLAGRVVLGNVQALIFCLTLHNPCYQETHDASANDLSEGSNP